MTEALEAHREVPDGIRKLDPRWDAFRGDPRFEEIVASLAPKETT